MRISLAGFSLAAAVRMVDGIHDDTAHVRSPAFPPRTPRFPDRDILMINVADLADRGQASR
jgi:hypothetical protein